MFYVYEYFKKETGEVFYVGKGTKNRYKELHNRNKYFNAVYSKYDCDVRKIYINLTNEEACQKEIERISELKSIGQAYCNFTNGGTGFSTGKNNPIHKRIKEGSVKLFDGTEDFKSFLGRTHSEETKKLMSQNRRGKGARFGKENPMYGKGFKGKDNPMYGKTGFEHPNSNMFKVIYLDGTEEYLTAKQCERKFSSAFDRIRNTGGTIMYKNKCKNSKYNGTELLLTQTCND